MYCTLADISDSIGNDLVRLSNDSDEVDQVNEPLVNSIISSVCKYIDTNLSTSYAVPIVIADDVEFLKPIAVSLVVCELYQKRHPLDYYDSLQARKKSALAELEKITSGGVRLNTGAASLSNDTGTMRVSKREPLFDNLIGY